MELRIKELRRQLGISLVQMSRTTGIHQRTLESYNCGALPSVKKIEQIAEAYGVNPAWLIGWSDLQWTSEPETIIVDKGRLPPYWNNDNDGQLIHWK